MVLVLVVAHMETESHQNCSQVIKIKVPHIYSGYMKIAVASKQARHGFSMKATTTNLQWQWQIKGRAGREFLQTCGQIL